MSYLYILFGPVLLCAIMLAAVLPKRWAFPHTEADKRALKLLRSWLTPEQLRQWSTRHEFEVIGCDTGIRYRITHRSAMNVYQLDPTGDLVAQWCFAPAGNLALGDILLAQKIALETMERETLLVGNKQRVMV